MSILTRQRPYVTVDRKYTGDHPSVIGHRLIVMTEVVTLLVPRLDMAKITRCMLATGKGRNVFVFNQLHMAIVTVYMC